ncbi:carboxypeptidase B-like isoform X2 [Chelonus insularis]|nr:carboxypeptidase B-like isoform X2 [Chelonus insularis]
MNRAYILIFLFLPLDAFAEIGVLRLIKDQRFWGSPLLRHPINHLPRYESITDYLESIASNYRNIVSLEDIGTTFEERTIYAVKISSGGIGKPKILIDAAMHGHEWMAPTVAIYAIHQLITNKSHTYLYQNVDWYIIPCLNPDGYEFTVSSGNRWWRKNRSINEGSSCIGTDINRNFDIGWMGKSNIDDPCSDFYRGFTPFSESESKALRNLFRSNRGLIKVYLTLHSFGMYFLYPWSWTKISTNNFDLQIVANKAARAITRR